MFFFFQRVSNYFHFVEPYNTQKYANFKWWSSRAREAEHHE